MFRKREAQQSLFSTSMLLPEEKRRRLEGSWAGAFRKSALPLIREELFQGLFHAEQGRPNKPVQTVVGILVLKEMFDSTDEEALAELEYDARWQVALDLEPEEAHCCQKTLHNFRAKLMEDDGARVLFEETTARIVEALGVKVERQRLDATHIVSNMALLTRLGLFCETVRVFLKELKRESKERYAAVPETWRKRYLKEDGEQSGYGDAKSSEARRRLEVCARDVWRLVDRFRGDERVKKLAGYGLLERLLAEQCAEQASPVAIAEGEADAKDGPVPVAVKEAKGVSSGSMQSPHDADATYSGHKGKGYEVQVAETVGNGDKPEVIVGVAVTRSCESDEKAALPMVDDLAARGMKPAEMVADTTYGSTGNVIGCAARGVELVSPVSGPAVAPPAQGELGLGDFEVDAQGQKPTLCPAGAEAQSETRSGEGAEQVRAVFPAASCSGCIHAGKCLAKLQADGTRVLEFKVPAAVLAQRRKYEATEEFRKRYAWRAGIEATNSEGKRAHGLGRLRVRGLLRVRLAVYFKALACNLKRMVRYLAKQAKVAARAISSPSEASGSTPDPRRAVPWSAKPPMPLFAYAA
jgi:hypothetical protein